MDKTDPETGRLAELLVVRALCNRPRSLTAVATARATGADPATIEIEILRWLAWLAHPKTNTSNLVNPGYFIAKKIADREPAPTGFVAAWSADEKRIQHLMCQREAAADTEDGEEEEEEEEEEDEEAAAADA